MNGWGLTYVGGWWVAFDVPGVKENTYFLKDLWDVRIIWARMPECESVVSPLHFREYQGGR